MAQLKDPVCGMTIDSETATERVTVGGETYYFCSEQCRKAFESDVERYVPRPAVAADAAEPQEELEKHEPPYTTWGFLTSPKFGSAGSGGLEYERLPEAHKPEDHKPHDHE